MRSFKDNQGNDWAVSLTAASLKRIKGTLDVDLLAMATDEKGENIFFKISSDPILLVDIIYVICKKEADSRNISDEQFGELLGGDSIEQATKAFIEELIDFFPTAKRPAFRKMQEKIQQLESKGLDYVMNRLDSPQLEKSFQDQVEKKFQEEISK